VEKSLESVFDLRAAFAPHVIGPGRPAAAGLEAGSKGKQVLAKLANSTHHRHALPRAAVPQPEHHRLECRTAAALTR